MKRINLGKKGESIAVQFLRGKGYTVLHKNYRTISGEIDLIAQFGKTLVFVEVKSRQSSFLDSPLEAITTKKMRQIAKVAQDYLCRNDKFDQDARFDVIAINVLANEDPAIEHIENAFDLNCGK